MIRDASPRAAQEGARLRVADASDELLERGVVLKDRHAAHLGKPDRRRVQQRSSTPDYWDEPASTSRRDRVIEKLIPQFGEGRLQSRGDAFTTCALDRRPADFGKAAQSVWDRSRRWRACTPPARAGGAGLEPSTLRAARLSGARWSTCATCAAISSGAVHVGSGGRWTTKPSSRSWSRSAASAAGPPRLFRIFT
jgi:hypothetical protein